MAANHDGSIASQVEDWIVTQLVAMQFDGGPAFDAADVLPWVGTDAATLGDFARELMSGTRDRIARVFFLNDQRAEELPDIQMHTVPLYVILIGIREQTPGAARRGSVRGATKAWGTNVMRDLLKASFNQRGPALDDGTTYTDQSHYLGASISYHPRNACIMRAEVTVDEVPKAT